jgi:tRNA A37 threonylcarbamoyltransferase TsaD
VEKEAANGDATRFRLPRPMHGRKDADFSLSGLKTALRLEAEKTLRSPIKMSPIFARLPAGDRRRRL